MGNRVDIRVEKARDWHGVFPALPTQLHADYSMDVDATMRHVHQMLDAGVHGVVMLGTIGENNALLPEEKRELLRATVTTVDGRVPVLTGVSEFTAAEAARYIWTIIPSSCSTRSSFRRSAAWAPSSRGRRGFPSWAKSASVCSRSFTRPSRRVPIWAS